MLSLLFPKCRHFYFAGRLADVWLGYNVVARLRADARIVTSSLTVDYLSSVGEGAWLQSRIDRVRIGRRTYHASGAIYSGDEPVAAMRGSYIVIVDAGPNIAGPASGRRAESN